VLLQHTKTQEVECFRFAVAAISSIVFRKAGPISAGEGLASRKWRWAAVALLVAAGTTLALNDAGLRDRLLRKTALSRFTLSLCFLWRIFPVILLRIPMPMA
jgi:hypothetical protein